jgi:hypothetical protein
MNNLAELYNYEAKYAEAEALYDSAEKIAHRVLGDQHGIRLNSLSGLADTYQGQGKYAQAETLYVEVLGFRRRVQGEEHPQTLETMTSLGKVLLLQRKYADAESVLRNDCNAYQKAQADTWQRSFCESLLGASLAGQKKFASAEPLLISGYDGLTQREAKMGATDRSNLKEARERIVELYQDWGKPEKAAEWKQKLQSGGHRDGKQE